MDLASLDAAPPAAEDDGADLIPGEATAAELGIWNEARIAVNEWLFGPGMVTPGGERALNALTEPLLQSQTLGEKSTIVDLGSGLGGLARHIAAGTGARVMGFEADLTLAEAAAARSAALGVQRQARIERSDLADFDLKPYSAHGAVSKEVLYHVADKAAVLARLARALRPGARLVLTDFVLTGSDPHSPEIAVWMAHEPLPIYLQTIPGTRELLSDAGIEVDDIDNITATYRSAVMSAFARAAGGLAKAPETVRLNTELLVAEGDFWTRRAAILETGQVEVVRIRATLRGEPV